VKFLDWLQRHQFAIFGLALVVLGAGLSVDIIGPHDRAGIEFAYGSGAPDGAPIRVQVAGAVVSPGVYEMRAGDRVVDAVAVAGGPSSVADLEALNLARRVRDEERLVVPSRAASLVPGARLDINTATRDQLDALPGIGEAYSRRIVDSRTVDGPYKSTQDLVTRNVLPSNVFEGIRDLIAASP
jgi:competence protein ComEA